MKLSLRLRQQTLGAAPRLPLFPFLAVLLCTMGVMVPLLLIITRTARLEAEATARAKIAEQLAAKAAEVRRQREDVQWRLEQLKLSREKTAAQLTEARLQLGHLEDHIRRLCEQLVRLKDAIAEADSKTRKTNNSGAAEAELAELQQRISQAHSEVEGVRGKRRQRSYAVVPYEGPNKTRRRPIYIECRADAVVLQPENIVLEEADFEGPLGPGNPLATALRAAREHLLAEKDFSPDVGEPYPLLLVRPSGIAAYYAARAAMRSWGFDFGYELIGEDWQLAFPPPNPRLAETVRQAVLAARVSQMRLAAAAPRHFGERPGVVYRAAPGRGGFVAVPAETTQWALPRGQISPAEPSPPPALPQRRPQPSDSGPPKARPSAEGFVAGRPPRESTSTPDSQLAENSAGVVLRPGEWLPPPESGKEDCRDKSHPKPPAGRRSADWALRGAGQGAVGVVRPIHIECYADRLVILPEHHTTDKKIIPFDSQTMSAVEPLIAAVWERIESWGIAGRGMYWRPLLRFSVAPDAETRFQELSTLLEGSGLLIERKPPESTNTQIK